MKTPIRYMQLAVTICALAIPVGVAHAEGGGGRDPVPYTPPEPSVGNTPTQSPAQTPTRRETQPARPSAQTTAAAPRPVRQSRTAAPRIVESAPSGLPPEEETRLIDDEVIVRFRLSSTAGSRNRAIAGLGMTHLEARTFFLAGVTVHRYRLRTGIGVRDAITRLEASAAVVNAQPNYLYRLQQSDGDGKLSQFGNEKVDLGDAHARTRGRDIRIAIIDTAIDATHPEFSGATLASFDVADDVGNVDPHGTSIAGILAADAKLTGVAPEAEILGIAAFHKDASGAFSGNTWTILEATNVAHEHDAHILNMSFAGPPDPLLARAMDGARKRDIIPVAAAGNDGPGAAPLYPAAYETVIAVTATDAGDAVYARANTGDHVDLAAPGVDLLVLGTSSGYRTSSGTSMATAYVSGIAALALSANPGAGYTAVRAMLENSATDLGAQGRDRVFGAGLPSAVAVLDGLTN